jgi:hypothetical protein
MGFRYQRRVTLFPGVRLNFSARGISASFGPRGASVTVGPRGTALNLGIPGTGISFRQNLTPSNGQPRTQLSPPPALPEVPVSVSTGTAIASAPIAEVTSESLEGLKDLIIKVLAERAELGRAIPVAREEVSTAERRLRRARNWFFGLFLKKKIPEREAALTAKTAALKDLEARHDGAFIDTEFALDQPTRAAFDQVADAFEQLALCHQIWDITTEEFTDRRVTRSAASRTLERKAVRFSISEDPVLQTESKVLSLQNANGADLLVYPGFLLMTARKDLALIDLREARLSYNQVRFVETEQLPADATVVDHTWAKCNKDGSPDRRFANNYRIPVAGYGRITICTAAGVNEEYQFSNAEKAERFAELFADYQNKLRALGARSTKAALKHAQLPAPEATRPTEAAPESPALTSGDVVLRAIEHLRTAEALSAQHAMKVLEEFVDSLKKEVETFSEAPHSMQVFERFANEVATAPGVVQAFLQRAPGTKQVARNLVKTARDMVADVLTQIRNGIEQADPSVNSTPEALKALKSIRAAESVLRK